MPTSDSRLDDLTTSALTCRTYNHNWRPVRNDGAMVATAYKGKKIIQVEEQLTCPECTTIRRDVYSYPDYESVVHKYKHPDGYRLRYLDGAPRMVKAEFRAALFNRRRPAIVQAA